MRFTYGGLGSVVPLLAALAALSSSSGCKGELAKRCEVVVHHLDAQRTPPGSEPDKDEQRVIDAISKASIQKCVAEGLSKAQADCILSVRTMEQLVNLGACPAIAAKRPSWLIVAPSSKELDEMQRALEQRQDAGT